GSGIQDWTVPKVSSSGSRRIERDGVRMRTGDRIRRRHRVARAVRSRRSRRVLEVGMRGK
ncbi:hypothetical protein A2U01_0117940, partial [Trifolium medium]|nr:hypothetical protein [Trifolium medium]